MPVNPEIRYWLDLALTAEAELDAATTHAELKRAAQRLMRARRRLLVLHSQETEANHPRPPRRRRRPPKPGLQPTSRSLPSSIDRCE